MKKWYDNCQTAYGNGGPDKHGPQGVVLRRAFQTAILNRVNRGEAGELGTESGVRCTMQCRATGGMMWMNRLSDFVHGVKDEGIAPHDDGD